MQQERSSGGGEMMKGLQQQEEGRKGKVIIQEQQQAPPQQPQKCPRCESLNTKFCYYNNYSLSQPRYFCKTCRRYWTQGGTLRNVPVGGGCRKGKRSKKPSSTTSSTTSSSDHSTILISNNNPSNSATQNLSLMRNKGIDQSLSPSSSPMLPPMASPLYYPSGGFLSSLAAFQPFNQGMSGGGDQFGGSNLALLQGFSLPSISPQQVHMQQHLVHQQQQEQVFNMGSSGRDPLELSRRSNSPHNHHHQDWSSHQSFNSNNNIPINNTTGYWSSIPTSTSTSTTTSSTMINNTISSGPSMNPTHHWSNLPAGFGPPPTTSSSSSPSFL